MKTQVLFALLGYTSAVKLSKHFPDVTFIQDDDEASPAEEKPKTFDWIDGQDEPKVIQVQQGLAQSSSDDLSHQLIEEAQPKSFEWIDSQDKVSIAQQAEDPNADNVETSQDEEAQADKDGDEIS